MSIKVLIADDVLETRENIRRLLSLDPDFNVVGEASNGKEAVSEAVRLAPDVVLMDINMPVMDGIAASEQINLRKSGASVIIMSVQGEQEYLRKAMLAGARDYIIKPFSNDELIDTIRRVYEMERKKSDGIVRKAFDDEPQVLSVFGTKGGVGKTTIAANLAVALKQATSAEVALVDLDLQFGDAAALLNIMPKQTIAELVQESGDIDTELVESYLLLHRPSGIRVLCAPVKPEHAELVTPSHIEQILKILRKNYQYVIVDTPSYFSDANLTALEISNKILMVVGLDLLTMKDTKLAVHIMESLNMRGKVDFVLNRSGETVGMKTEDLEHAMDCEIWAHIPANGKIAVGAINKGVPFTLTYPTANISEGIINLANLIVRGKAPGKKRQRLLASFF